MRLPSVRLFVIVGLATVFALPPQALSAQTLAPNGQTTILPASREECALLDDAETRERMDGLLFALIWRCGRTELLGEVQSKLPPGVEVVEGVEGAPDIRVNRVADDTIMPTTQSETAIMENPATGTLCSHYNDSCEFFCPDGGGGFTGVSRSTDGGATWVDQGALHPNTFGDPTVVYRQADGNLYAAALHNTGGLGIYRSTDDCVSFTEIAVPTAGGDDKELLAVDNTGGTHDGNLYMAWVDFGSGGRIFLVRSTDGGITWSAQLGLSPAGASVQGAWPAVAPNGDVYVGWVTWLPPGFPNGDVEATIVRSTDGGLTFNPVTPPMTGEDNPRDSTATASCGRPALNGNIRYLPSPQLAVGPDGVLHVVYSYDPDGFGVGDVVDSFYRRSTDSGATWGPEIRVHDDATQNDQYFPTLAVGSNNDVVVSWYDRRLDPGNLLQDTFRVVSNDGGVTWGPNERVSDVSSPITLDGALAACYHGDYDQSLITTANSVVVQWADDRNSPDLADVYTDTQSLSEIFADGFESGDTSAWSASVP